VIGGGNSGFEEGLFLTQFAKHVTIVERGPMPKASRLLQDKVMNHPKMTVLLETGLDSFVANDDSKLDAVVLVDSDGNKKTHKASGAFLFVGLDPNTGWLDGLVETDATGFVTTDRNFETSVPGLFAAGDVRGGSTKQLASAVGEGAAVALQIRHHLDTLSTV
jgi:thioredoxin reductase (NADPH)